MIREFIRIISFKSLRPIHWVLIFTGFLIIHIPAIIYAPKNVNAYEILAKSLYKGKLTLSESDIPYIDGTQIKNTGDLIFYHNKYYLPYPPAPVLVLMPFVIFGDGFPNSILIAVLLTCLNIFLTYKIFQKLKIKDIYIPWLIYGFFFGTGYWYVLLSAHHVYGFAEVVSVTGILLLLNDLFGEKRAILMGIFLGMAFLSRQFTVFLAIFVIGYLVNYYFIQPIHPDRRLLWRKSLLFLGSLGLSIILYCLYNYVRFGNPMDTGYEHIAFLGALKERVDQHGVFNFHYVLYNLYSYLFKGFNIKFTGNEFLHIKDVDLYGSAVLIASPFLVASFKTGWNRFLKRSAWIAIGIIFTGLLFYHNNGKDQINTSRFALDFLPLMLVLASQGIQNIPPWLFKGMIIYSILLNVIAYGIHFLYHTYPY